MYIFSDCVPIIQPIRCRSKINFLNYIHYNTYIYYVEWCNIKQRHSFWFWHRYEADDPGILIIINSMQNVQVTLFNIRT